MELWEWNKHTKGVGKCPQKCIDFENISKICNSAPHTTFGALWMIPLSSYCTRRLNICYIICPMGIKCPKCENVHNDTLLNGYTAVEEICTSNYWFRYSGMLRRVYFFFKGAVLHVRIQVVSFIEHQMLCVVYCCIFLICFQSRHIFADTFPHLWYVYFTPTAPSPRPVTLGMYTQLLYTITKLSR